jgi:hypothetical protein
MIYGVVFACSGELVSQWWRVLEQSGLNVELRIPSKRIAARVPVSCNYRNGVVRGVDALVAVVSSPGAHPSSTSPLRGKHVLILQFGGLLPRARQRNRTLMHQVARVLLRNGATLVRRRKRKGRVWRTR